MNLLAQIPTSEEAFASAMGVLGIATRHEVTPEELEVYFAGLSDIPWPTLQRGLAKLARSASFFPAVGDIRRACDEVAERERRANQAEQLGVRYLPTPTEAETRTFTLHGATLTVKVLPDGHPALPRYHCLACQDEGWEPTKIREFGQIYDAVRRCACYATNPVIARRLSMKASFA